MRFKEVRAEDKEIIDEIIRVEEEAFGRNGGVDEWILKPLIRNGKVFVLMKDEKIVSIAEYMAKFQSEEIFLYGLCTEKDSRGKGYAKEILKRSIEYFSGKSIKKMSLTVSPEHEIAITLYKTLGFEVEKIYEDEYGKGIGRLKMSKKI